MRRRGWVAVVAILASALAACGGPAGVRHRVERGESLYRIGQAYGVSPETLARVNGIKTARHRPSCRVARPRSCGRSRQAC